MCSARGRRLSGLYQHPMYGSVLCSAHRHAARMGLCPADCEDCAMEFLLRQLQLYGDPETLAALPPALLHRSASNHAKNVLRARVRSRVREVPDIEKEDAATAPSSGPEAALLRRAFWEEIQPYLHRLRREHREALLRYYGRGDDVQEIAAMLGARPETVEQWLARARRRLRCLMEESGIGPTDLHEYLQTNC